MLNMCRHTSSLMQLLRIIMKVLFFVDIMYCNDWNKSLSKIAVNLRYADLSDQTDASIDDMLLLVIATILTVRLYVLSIEYVFEVRCPWLMLDDSWSTERTMRSSNWSYQTVEEKINVVRVVEIEKKYQVEEFKQRCCKMRCALMRIKKRRKTNWTKSLLLSTFIYNIIAKYHQLPWSPSLGLPIYWRVGITGKRVLMDCPWRAIIKKPDPMLP